MAEVESFGANEAKICLRAGDAKIVLSSFGAGIVEAWLPDSEGNLKDIVLGFDNLEAYRHNPACHGMTIGPIANRTDKADIPLLGKHFTLEKNDGPSQENNLHSSKTAGLQMRHFNYKTADNICSFTTHLQDGELGLPGNKNFAVIYMLTETEYAKAKDGKAVTLEITLEATTDAPCPINMTNHSYFNLSGDTTKTIDDTEVQLQSDAYLPLRADSVSLGEIRDVTDTVFDFREPKALSSAIHAKDEQIEIARGLDHCFVIRGANMGSTPRLALSAKDAATKRALDIEITAPAAHLYTGNWLDDKAAKGEIDYKPYVGFAFEPEYYPDFIHHSDWPQSIATADAPFREKIVYHFYVY